MTTIGGGRGEECGWRRVKWVYGYLNSENIQHERAHEDDECTRGPERITIYCRYIRGILPRNFSVSGTRIQDYVYPDQLVLLLPFCISLLTCVSKTMILIPRHMIVLA